MDRDLPCEINVVSVSYMRTVAPRVGAWIETPVAQVGCH